MLKRIFCILLIALMASVTLTRLFYFAGYQLNRDYIAKELCINKDKPALNCNGKCFLSKKIAEAEKKKQSSERKTQKDLSQQNVVISEFKTVFLTNETLPSHPYYLKKRTITISSSVFHPPQSI